MSSAPYPGYRASKKGRAQTGSPRSAGSEGWLGSIVLGLIKGVSYVMLGALLTLFLLNFRFILYDDGAFRVEKKRAWSLKGTFYWEVPPGSGSLPDPISAPPQRVARRYTRPAAPESGAGNRATKAAVSLGSRPAATQSSAARPSVGESAPPLATAPAVRTKPPTNSRRASRLPDRSAAVTTSRHEGTPARIQPPARTSPPAIPGATESTQVLELRTQDECRRVRGQLAHSVQEFDKSASGVRMTQLNLMALIERGVLDELLACPSGGGLDLSPSGQVICTIHLR